MDRGGKNIDAYSTATSTKALPNTRPYNLISSKSFSSSWLVRRRTTFRICVSAYMLLAGLFLWLNFVNSYAAHIIMKRVYAAYCASLPRVEVANVI